MGIVLPVIAGLFISLLLGPLAGVAILIGGYFIDIGFLCILIMGWLTGYLVGKILIATKTRNERLAFWSGIFAGVTLVLSASFWFYMFAQMGDLSAATGLENGVYYPWEAPTRVYEVINAYVFEVGKKSQIALLTILVALITKLFTISVEFPGVSGLWLYSLWIVEAIFVVLWSGITSRQLAGKHGFIFCENCKKPAVTLFKSPLLAPIPAAFSDVLTKLQSDFEHGQFQVLPPVVWPNEITEPGDYSRLILKGCDSCDGLYCLDMLRVKVKWDGDHYRDSILEEIDDEDNPAVEHLLVSQDTYQRLVDRYTIA